RPPIRLRRPIRRQQLIHNVRSASYVQIRKPRCYTGGPLVTEANGPSNFNTEPNKRLFKDYVLSQREACDHFSAPRPSHQHSKADFTRAIFKICVRKVNERKTANVNLNSKEIRIPLRVFSISLLCMALLFLAYLFAFRHSPLDAETQQKANSTKTAL